MTNICSVCNQENKPGHAPSPEEAVAAAICWLTRQGKDPVPSNISEKLARRRRHPATGCRYCGTSPADIISLISRGFAHESQDSRWVAWTDLSSKAHYAKVCRAQELSWIDALPAEA